MNSEQEADFTQAFNNFDNGNGLVNTTDFGNIIRFLGYEPTE